MRKTSLSHAMKTIVVCLMSSTIDASHVLARQRRRRRRRRKGKGKGKVENGQMPHPEGETTKRDAPEGHALPFAAGCR